MNVVHGHPIPQEPHPAAGSGAAPGARPQERKKMPPVVPIAEKEVPKQAA